MSNQEDYWKKVEIPASVKDRAKAMSTRLLERWFHVLEDEAIALIFLASLVAIGAVAAVAGIVPALTAALLTVIWPMLPAEVRRRELKRDWRTEHAVRAVKMAKEYNRQLFPVSQAIKGLHASHDSDKAAAAEALIAGQHRALIRDLQALDASYQSTPGIEERPPLGLIEQMSDAEAEVERAQEVLAETLRDQIEIRKILGGELKDY